MEFNFVQLSLFSLMKTDEWMQAVAADAGSYISKYAHDHPHREDVSESSTSWYAIRVRADRQDPRDVQITEDVISNRMDYFDRHFHGL